MFKIWYILIILYYLFLCAVHMMQGFVYEKMLKGNYNYSQCSSFLKGNEENPALVLSKGHNRTSARDGPMFGSMGHSINTSSLGWGKKLQLSQKDNKKSTTSRRR
jgi:hypothetical protein